ncbi:MAG TPA: VanZ family protein [Flavisolibacter sp.]
MRNKLADIIRSKWLQSAWLAAGWLTLMSILFILPATAFPKENFLDRIYFDKWVHIGLFAVLVFLWNNVFPGHTWLIIIAAGIYGLLVEWVQGTWVPNRSFDIYDWTADAAGIILGLFVWLRAVRVAGAKKNKPL